MDIESPRSFHSYHGESTSGSSNNINNNINSNNGNTSNVYRTTGESLACLVGASITTVDNTVYVLGGFDRYSDEVFNTLYQLTFDRQQATYCWTRLAYNNDNNTTVMAKRNDHTATLWHDKLVVFGGTGEDDHYFNQVAILHLRTLTWEHPETTGRIPLGRIKHSATVYQDKLYIAGGIEQGDHDADTVLILDLNTYEWQPPLTFVQRTQHMTFFYNKRLYLFGGYHKDMSRSNVLSFLDLETHTVTQLEIDSPSAPPLVGEQFAQICGDQMVVVVTPACLSLHDEDDDYDYDDEDQNGHTMKDHKRHRIGLWHLDLTSMQWQYHDISARLLEGGIHWQYFAMAEHANSFVLFGATDDELDEYYTMMLRIHLKEHGIVAVPPSQLGMDLAGLLTLGNANADFTIRSTTSNDTVHVHRLVLLARWPHFSHLMNAGMVESLSDCMTLPEPLDVLKAFVRFLYTDTLEEHQPAELVADLMVMANLYLLPRLLALCVRRLYTCITVEHVSKVYQAAVDAGQEGLQQTAVTFIFRHFGWVTRTHGFRTLSPAIMTRLLDQIPFFASVLLAPPSSAVIAAASSSAGYVSTPPTSSTSTSSIAQHQQQFADLHHQHHQHHPHAHAPHLLQHLHPRRSMSPMGME